MLATLILTGSKFRQYIHHLLHRFTSCKCLRYKKANTTVIRNDLNLDNVFVICATDLHMSPWCLQLCFGHDPKLDNSFVICPIDFHMSLWCLQLFRHDPNLDNVFIIVYAIDLHMSPWCLQLFLDTTLSWTTYSSFYGFMSHVLTLASLALVCAVR